MTTRIEEARKQVLLSAGSRDYARLELHDLVEQSNEAGKATRGPVDGGIERPSARQVQDAILALEKAAVRLYRDVQHHEAELNIVAAERAHAVDNAVPLYFWPGKNGRKGILVAAVKNVRQTEMQKIHLPCRLVESLEPLTLGHMLLIPRVELHLVGSDMQPLPKAPNEDITDRPAPPPSNVVPMGKGGSATGDQS